MKKISLLTSLDSGEYIHDDHLLVNALENSGFLVSTKPWENLRDDGEDLFIVRTTWNYTEHFQDFVRALTPIKDRLWNPLPLINWNSNKKYLVDLYQKGLDIMPLYLADDESSLNLAIEKLGGDEFVIKPLMGASAKGLKRFNESSPPALQQEMIVQRFYPQITEGEVSLVFFNGEFSYAIKKTPKSGEIRVQEEFGSKVTPHIPTGEELKSAIAVTKEIPHPWLYARVDIVPGAGVIELECIEPSLFFSYSERSAEKFTKAIVDILERPQI